MSESNIPRQYKDVSGNPTSLRWLVLNEPKWAENQIRHRDTLERELTSMTAQRDALREAGDRMARDCQFVLDEDAAAIEAMQKMGFETGDPTSPATRKLSESLAAWSALTK